VIVLPAILRISVCRSCLFVIHDYPRWHVNLNYAVFVSKLWFRARFDHRSAPFCFQITDKIIRSGGPISYSTQPGFVPFHDDKNTYTGASKYGDPSLTRGSTPSFTRSSSTSSHTGRIAQPPEHRPGMPIGGRRSSVGGTSQVRRVIFKQEGKSGYLCFAQLEELQRCKCICPAYKI
jgi:hypothetical protein